jgi:hypothetical protein
MLGRLEMDIDECISAYSRLIKTVFDEKSSWLPFGWTGKINAQFDSARLKSTIKEVITSRSLPEAELFNNGAERGCRV